jgi:hypothetical protein
VNVERISIGGFSLPVPITATVLSPTREAGAGNTWRTLARVRISEAGGRAREWAAERFLVAGTTLKRRDQSLWQRAESVQDLCDLTVGWLRGEIASQPGYYGAVDVDEDDAPGLTDALVELNRIGFWTRTSQAGADREGYDGARWTQLAAVDGFADHATVERLENALAGTQYRIQAHPTREQGHDAVVVTRREGQAYTGFGGSMDDEDIAIQVAGVGARAARAAHAGAQVVIWDPVAGRNTLWAVLSGIAQSSMSAAARADHPGVSAVARALPDLSPDQESKEVT